MKKSTKKKEAPAARGGARNKGAPAPREEIAFAQEMDAAAAGALKAAATCLVVAAARTPSATWREGRLGLSRLALVLEGVARGFGGTSAAEARLLAKMGAEVERKLVQMQERTFKPCGEEVAR